MQCKEVVNPYILEGLLANIPFRRDEKSWGNRDGIGNDANPSAPVAQGLKVLDKLKLWPPPLRCPVQFPCNNRVAFVGCLLNQLASLNKDEHRAH
jgi:hypothetical protein